MKYIRNTAGYTWTDCKTNTEIAKELNTTPVLDKIQDYRMKLDTTCQQNTLWPVTQDNKQQQTKSKNQGRPMKRLLDVRDQNKSSSDPAPWQLDDDDDDIEMDFKKKGDGKAWTGFIWLMTGTAVIYNPHDTVQHPHKHWMFSNMAAWYSVLWNLKVTPLDFGTDHWHHKYQCFRLSTDILPSSPLDHVKQPKAHATNEGCCYQHLW